MSGGSNGSSDDDHKLVPPIGNSELEFDCLTLHGRKYKASNVNRCANCNNSLMFRMQAWPPNQWECDNCGTRQESK